MFSVPRALSGEGASLGVPPDEVARLLEVWPEEKVLAPLVAFASSGSDPTPLRDVEKQLLPLLAIPRVRQRLRLLVLAGTAEKRVGEGIAQLQLLRRACYEIQDWKARLPGARNTEDFQFLCELSDGSASLAQNSSLLRELLAIIVLLFNYVNFGAAPPSARQATSGALKGVDVPSLLRLRETKAFKGDFPGFHIVHLERVQSELQELRGEYVFVQTELQDHREDYHADGSESDDEAEEPLEEPANWGFLEKLLARGLDFANLAEAWLRGDEVLGRPYHPSVGGFRAFEPLQGEEGSAPPSWLWLQRPSGRWQRCWSEVRGPILVLYKVELHQCVGATYVALPGALLGDSVNKDEVLAQREEELLAGEDAAPASASTSFELITTGESSGRLLRLRASSKKQAASWKSVLEEVASRPGAGYLTVSGCTSSEHEGTTCHTSLIVASTSDKILAGTSENRSKVERRNMALPAFSATCGAARTRGLVVTPQTSRLHTGPPSSHAPRGGVATGWRWFALWPAFTRAACRAKSACRARWSAYNAGHGVELNDDENVAKRKDTWQAEGKTQHTGSCSGCIVLTAQLLVQLMASMEPLRPEILRCTCAFRALKGLQAKSLRSRVNPKVAYSWSHETKDIQQFWSHSWRRSGWSKIFMLAVMHNGFPALCCGTLTAISVSILFHVFSEPVNEEIGDSLRDSWEQYTAALSVGRVAGLISNFSAMLVGALCLAYWRCQKTVFLDMVCIHQKDSALKMAGLVSMGAFLSLGPTSASKESNSMLVCWDATYNHRLWCLFELAAFLKSRGNSTARPLVVRPTALGPVALGLFTGLSLGIMSLLLVPRAGSSASTITLRILVLLGAPKQMARVGCAGLVV
eukprot:g11945.t1